MAVPPVDRPAGSSSDAAPMTSAAAIAKNNDGAPSSSPTEGEADGRRFRYSVRQVGLDAIVDSLYDKEASSPASRRGSMGCASSNGGRALLEVVAQRRRNGGTASNLASVCLHPVGAKIDYDLVASALGGAPVRSSGKHDKLEKAARRRSGAIDGGDDGSVQSTNGTQAKPTCTESSSSEAKASTQDEKAGKSRYYSKLERPRRRGSTLESSLASLPSEDTEGVPALQRLAAKLAGKAPSYLPCEYLENPPRPPEQNANGPSEPDKGTSEQLVGGESRVFCRKLEKSRRRRNTVDSSSCCTLPSAERVGEEVHLQVPTKLGSPTGCPKRPYTRRVSWSSDMELHMSSDIGLNLEDEGKPEEGKPMRRKVSWSNLQSVSVIDTKKSPDTIGKLNVEWAAFPTMPFGRGDAEADALLDATSGERHHEGGKGGGSKDRPPRRFSSGGSSPTSTPRTIPKGDAIAAVPPPSCNDAPSSPTSLPNYHLGHTAKNPSHMIVPATPAQATEYASSLHPLDFAFVLRSSGEWTYSIVADMPAGAEGPSIRFVLDGNGSTKTIRRKYWGQGIRLVNKEAAVEEGDDGIDDGGEAKVATGRDKDAPSCKRSEPPESAVDKSQTSRLSIDSDVAVLNYGYEGFDERLRGRANGGNSRKAGADEGERGGNAFEGNLKASLEYLGMLDGLDEQPPSEGMRQQKRKSHFGRGDSSTATVKRYFYRPKATGAHSKSAVSAGAETVARGSGHNVPKTGRRASTPDLRELGRLDENARGSGARKARSRRGSSASLHGLGGLDRTAKGPSSRRRAGASSGSSLGGALFRETTEAAATRGLLLAALHNADDDDARADKMGRRASSASLYGLGRFDGKPSYASLGSLGAASDIAMAAGLHGLAPLDKTKKRSARRRRSSVSSASSMSSLGALFREMYSTGFDLRRDEQEI